MSLTETKKDLKILVQNPDVYPFWRTERYTKDRNSEILWVVSKEFGIRGNGNIVYNDGRGRRTDNTFNTFFLKPRISSPCLEKEVKESVADLLLLVEMKQGTLNARDITKCKNAEIRRVLMERFGYEKFLREMKGVVTHRDGDSRLIRIDWHKNEESIKLVRVKDSSTNRYYLLRVPPNVRTCKEAVAWTFGMGEDQYNPLKET